MACTQDYDDSDNSQPSGGRRTCQKKQCFVFSTLVDRGNCALCTKYVYVFIGAYYQPSLQCYVSYVVMMLPERQPWCKLISIYLIRCEMRRELSVQEGAEERKKAHQLGGSNNLTRPLQLKFRATKTFAVSVKDHTPRSSEERTSSLPQYLDYRDSTLQQRQHSLLLL